MHKIFSKIIKNYLYNVLSNPLKCQCFFVIAIYTRLFYSIIQLLYYNYSGIFMRKSYVGNLNSGCSPIIINNFVKPNCGFGHNFKLWCVSVCGPEFSLFSSYAKLVALIFEQSVRNPKFRRSLG